MNIFYKRSKRINKQRSITRHKDKKARGATCSDFETQLRGTTSYDNINISWSLDNLDV